MLYRGRLYRDMSIYRYIVAALVRYTIPLFHRHMLYYLKTCNL